MGANLFKSTSRSIQSIQFNFSIQKYCVGIAAVLWIWSISILIWLAYSDKARSMWPGHISIRGGLRSIVHIEPLGVNTYINQLLKSTNWLFAKCSYNMFLYERSSLMFTIFKSSKLVFMLCTQLLHIFVTIVVFLLLINHILKFKVMDISEDNLFMYKKGTAPCYTNH